MAGRAKVPQPLRVECVFCGEAWTAEMWAKLLSYDEGCESCGYGAEARFEVAITCSNCDRVIYRKECVHREV